MTPVEVRVDQTGNTHDIFNNLYQIYTNNQLVTQYIRTTVGRILLNHHVFRTLNTKLI
jgi:hypothetical protein